MFVAGLVVARIERDPGGPTPLHATCAAVLATSAPGEQAAGGEARVLERACSR